LGLRCFGQWTEALPLGDRQRYNEILSTVEDPKGFEDELIAGYYLESVLAVNKQFALDATGELSRSLFREKMTPGQVVSRALQNEDMIERWAVSWNSLAYSQRPTEPPTVWQEMVNRVASALASVGSAAAEAARRSAERGAPTLFLATPTVRTEQEREADAKAAEEMKNSAQLLWEISKDPELAAQRDDLMSKVLGLGAQTIPYITATTAATILGGPMGGFAVGYMVEGNRAYQTARDNGVPEPVARNIGMAVGTVSGAIESIGGRVADKALKKVSDKIANYFVRTGAQLTLGSLSEAMEEGGQELAAIVGQSTYDKTVWDQALRRTLSAADISATSRLALRRRPRRVD
jgi:hypothetical protein